MKNIFLAILLCLASALCSNAQDAGEQRTVKRFIEKEFKYHQDGLSVVKISPQMFEMMKQSSSSSSPEVKNMLKQLKELYVVSYKKNGKGKKNADAIKRLNIASRLIAKDYDEVMAVRENGNSSTQVWTKSENGRIVDFLLIVSDSTKYILINILGDIDLKALSNLRSVLNVNELDNLTKIDPSKMN